MDYLQDESKPGYYDMFQNNQDGKKYIVLDGLNPADIHTPGVLEQWTHQRYSQLELVYWIIFFVTLIYLILTYLAIPLMEKFQIRLWPKTEIKNKS